MSSFDTLLADIISGGGGGGGGSGGGGGDGGDGGSGGGGWRVEGFGGVCFCVLCCGCVVKW